MHILCASLPRRLYLISTKTVAAAAAVKVKGQEKAKLTPRLARDETSGLPYNSGPWADIDRRRFVNSIAK